jgi:recombinational DNA repair ATPase RecF
MADWASIMAHVDNLNTVVGELPAAIETVRQEIQALKDQIAAGSNVTQEQLDALDGQLVTMGTNVTTARDNLHTL